jgi:hypothetical protein
MAEQLIVKRRQALNPVRTANAEDSTDTPNGASFDSGMPWNWGLGQI